MYYNITYTVVHQTCGSLYLITALSNPNQCDLNLCIAQMNDITSPLMHIHTSY